MPEGFHAYIQDYRNKQDIGGADSGDWALRAMEQCNKTYQSVSELRDQVGETLTYIQDTFARVQAAGDDRAAIQSILNDVIRHQCAWPHLTAERPSVLFCTHDRSSL